MRDTWVTVNGTAQALINPSSGNRDYRAEVMMRNPGPTTVWIGKNDASLGVSHGVPIFSGETGTFSTVNEGLYIRRLTADPDQIIYALVTGVNT